MKLLITSNGLANDSIKNKLKSLVSGKIKIAFIPTSGNIVEGPKHWLINDLVNCQSVGGVDIIDISALEKEVSLTRIKECNVIVMGGGHAPYLMTWLKKSGLDKELLDLLKDRIYVGISAGGIVTGKDLKTSSQHLYLKKEGIECDGLNFVDFRVRPHLNAEGHPRVTEENLKEDLKGLDTDVYALDDDSAIYVEDGEIKEIISEGKWLKFEAKENTGS